MNNTAKTVLTSYIYPTIGGLAWVGGLICTMSDSVVVVTSGILIFAGANLFTAYNLKSKK